MDSLTILFPLLGLALAAVGIGHLLAPWTERTPRWAKWYMKLVEALPLWLLVLPIALSASYLATRISLSPDPNANYWPALGLWLGGMTLLLIAFVTPLRRSEEPPSSSRLPWLRILRSELSVIVFVAAISLTLRVANLDAHLFDDDEEALGSQALEVVAGNIKNMFSIGWLGHPNTQFFIRAGALKTLGISIVSLRSVSALAGTAAVVVTYLLLREMFGRSQGLIGALFMAGYHFHLHFSRVAHEQIWDTLIAASAMYFAYRASRDQRSFDFAALGLISGLSLYGYGTARAVPLVVAAYLIYVTISHRKFLPDNFGRIALMAVTFCLAAMPIGAASLEHPALFQGRLSSVGLFQSGWYEQQLQLGESPTSILWDQVVHAFGGFVYYPIDSHVILYDTPPPMIPGLAAVPFIAGLVYSILHIEKKEHALLLLGLVVPTILGGVLTVPPTSWQRFLGVIPAIAGLVALGLWQLAAHVLFWKRAAISVLAFLALILLAAENIDLYFQAPGDMTFNSVLRWQTARYVGGLPKDARIYWFGAPAAYAYFAPFSLHDRRLIEVFDPTPEVLPEVDHPSPSAYLFMTHRESELSPLVSKCPGGMTKTLTFHDAKVLTVYEMLQENTCVPTLEPPPANDHFLNSLPVTSVPFSETVSTKAATLDPGEPQPGPPIPGNPLPCGGVNNTVWYSFTPSADIRLTAEAVGSSADTLVTVYEGSDLNSLTPVACSAHLPDRQARVEFTARAGVPYHFQVAALSYSLGSVTFKLVES